MVIEHQISRACGAQIGRKQTWSGDSGAKTRNNPIPLPVSMHALEFIAT
jgi:hypothetical protein